MLCHDKLLSVLIASALIWLPSAAGVASEKEAALRFANSNAMTFNPADGETAVVSFELDAEAQVTLSIYTGDGDRVWQRGPEKLDGGSHAWHWSGEDSGGMVVPDEAYHPVLRCDCPDGEVTIDPRRNSGGELISDVVAGDMSQDGVIHYELPQAARVQLRIGIRNGALVEVLEDWEPHAAGSIRRSWDGYGVLGKQRLLDHPKIAFAIRAFSLPDNTIIAVGNNNHDYREYRKERRSLLEEGPIVGVDADVVDYRVAPEASQPASKLRNPEVSLEIIEGIQRRDEEGLPVVDGPVSFRVDMPQPDRDLMRSERYEVAFLRNYEFIGEQEKGYMPLTWRWGADVESGIHDVIVNVISRRGRVGVAGVRLRVADSDG